MSNAAADIAALERISTRVALTKEADLEALVGKLLCPVILKMGADDAELRKAVLKLVSLLNTRIKASPELKLPAQEIIKVYRENKGSPLIANVALMELVMALERCAAADLRPLIGKLAEGVSKEEGKHKRDLLHLSFAALTALAADVKNIPSSSQDALREVMPFLTVKEDRDEILRFGTNLLFYSPVGEEPASPARPNLIGPSHDAAFYRVMHQLQPEMLASLNAQGGPARPGAPAAAQPRRGAGAGGGPPVAQLLRVGPGGETETVNAVGEPEDGDDDYDDGGAEAMDTPADTPSGGRREPGLSCTDSEELSLAPAGLEIDEKGLQRRRMAVVRLCAVADDLEPKDVLLPMLAASCDPNEEISRAADDLLRKKATYDGLKPAVDLEDETLVSRIFEMLAGSPRESVGGVAAAAPVAQKLPVAPALRVKLYRLCCKSVTSCNMMPHTLKVIEAGIMRWGGPQVQQAACEYTVWVLQHATQATMDVLARPALRSTVGALQKLPAGSTGSHLPLRGFLYQAVGMLAQRAPEVFGADVEVAARFFAALAAEPDGIRATVQEAINRLAAAFKALPTPAARRELQRMLDAQARSTSESVRTCAVSWAVEIFPLDDPFSRTMCMRAAADPRPGIRNIALKGLGLQPSFHSGTLTALKTPLVAPAAAAAQTAAVGAADDSTGSGGDTAIAVAVAGGAAASGGSSATAAQRPTFAAMLTAVRSAFSSLRGPPVRSDLVVAADTLSAIIAFLNACEEDHPSSGATPATPQDATMKDADESEDADMAAPEDEGTASKNVLATEAELVYGSVAHVAVLEHGVVREAPTELQLLSLATLLKIAASNPSAAASHFASRLPFVRAFVSHTSPDVRLTAARLLGAMSQALPPDATTSLISHLMSRLPGSGGDDIASKGDSSSAAETDSTKATVAKFDELHGSVLALGLIASGTCIRDGKAGSQFTAVARAIAGEMCHGDVAVATAATRALGFMQLTGFEMLPLGEVEKTASDTADGAEEKVPKDKVPKTSPKSAAGGPAPATMMQVCSKIQTLLTDPRHPKDLKTRLPLLHACGHLTARMPAHACRAALVDILLSQTPPSTVEDMHAAVGEALALAFCGADTPVATTYLFTAHTKVSQVLSHLSDDSSSAKLQDDVTLHSCAERARSQGQQVYEADTALKEKILECSVKRAMGGSVAESAAAAVWLVALLMFCGGHEAVRQRLDKMQSVFVHLMGNAGSDLAQDMASHGLAAVYTAGDDTAKQRMASTLVETLTGATGPPASKSAASSSSKPTDGAAADVTAKPSATAQGALATYKDLCALAVALERPQLLYALIDVAAEATPHAARRGSLLGVRSSSEQASRKLLEGHASALLPKLYRGSYDPNPRVAESMSHILVTIVPQRAAALTENFAAVMRELLDSLAGRPWRARQAACLGAADILPGRRWGLLQGTFGELWEVALRVADDIKDSVRVNGERLLRAVGNVTKRLADSKQTSTPEATAALAVAMPLLVQKGLQFRSASVRNACITTLAAVVAVAAPADIAPQLAPLISGLLEALSSLESSAMGQLEMEVARRGMDVGQLDEKRVQLANRSPLQGALDTCARLVDEHSVAAVTTAVAALLKSGIGVSTRTGAARFVTALADRLPAAVLQKPAGEFLKALLPALRAERRAVTQRALAAATGAMAKCASGKRLEWLVGEVSNMMDLEDEQERLGGAQALQHIVRQAADRLPQATSAALLPLLLRARYDPSAPVATAAADTWAELGGATAATLRMHGAEALKPIVQTLGGDGPSARRQAAAAAAGGIAGDAGTGLPPDLAAGLAMALCAVLPGRMLPFKAGVARSLAAVAVAAPDAFTATPPCRPHPTLTAALPPTTTATPQTPPSDTSIVKLLVATSVKKGGDVGAHEVAEAAGDALVKVLEAFKVRDHLGEMAPIQDCAAVHAAVTASGATKMDTDDAEASAGKLPLLKCLEVITAAVSHAAPATVEKLTDAFAPCMCACLAASRHWSVRAQSCRLAEKVLKKIPEGSGSSAQKLLLSEGEGGVLACALDVSTEKVSQARSACLACIQAAVPHIGASDPMHERVKGTLKQMAEGDKDPALRVQAATALQATPFSNTDGAEPMQE